MRRILLTLALALAACAGGERRETAPDEAALAAQGRAIAESQCAVCHAVGEFGESPRAAAPPFRRLLSRYDPAALAQDLAEGIRIGHPDMPRFDLPIQGVDSLVAYLRAIQEPPQQSP